MRLKSLTLKGFKSFPERTRLDFGPGVSVVVGPNGSGKSNVTDAVLWAMGEQSPLAVRGSSMQDVIFGGAHGLKARGSAEVEIVLDNSDGTVDLPLSEISILRRLDRSGEGEYRLNGAHCRLTDVIEVLSDTGLGKETHSVISQGRVEAIVTSKPRDRRLLIEEAAGLGKHRKRRRRAQLKLQRTQENLDRALDVEREARTHLRPLKRQAEAAELHERLEHQMLEVRLELAVHELHGRSEELAAAEEAVSGARSQRQRVEEQLQAVIERRGVAERALSERAEQREQDARRTYGTRSALERVQMRLELSRATHTTLTQRLARTDTELEALTQDTNNEDRQRMNASSEQHIGALEAELAELERTREAELEAELSELREDHSHASERLLELEEQLQETRGELNHADEHAEEARQRLSDAERELERARRDAAGIGAELAAVNQFLRCHTNPARIAHPDQGEDSPLALSEALQVKPGYELALAAALAGRLDATIARDLPHAQRLLDRAGPDGASALLALSPDATEAEPPNPGVPGALRLIDLLNGEPEMLELARRLLRHAWVVERLEDLPDSFGGIAVTRGGRVWFAWSGEVRQLSEGGSERVLHQRNERERLIGQSELAVKAEHGARAVLQRMGELVLVAEQQREELERTLREGDRRRAEAQEAQRRSAWLIEQRSNMPQQGPQALRRAQLEGELVAERRQSELRDREAQERQARVARLGARHSADEALIPAAVRLTAALEELEQTLTQRATQLEHELSQDRAAGEEMAAQLRMCAAQEAEIQSRLRAEGETITEAELAAQRLRDQTSESRLELESVCERLGLQTPSLSDAQPLAQEQLDALSARAERLTRRREQLGPVNPLAQEEYAQALEHVEELERRRTDLETALRELRTLIRDTDRQIEETFNETFQLAASNFSQLVGDVFPGGTGTLRLVDDHQTQRPVLGGQQVDRAAGDSDPEAAEESEGQEEAGGEEPLGVEIEVTPAGKSTKRLSLLSGGEKSMTALAFLFAVFLARPCPFYILDEVEAALDDLNLDRFLTLLRRYAGRAQFIVITHQKRTMEAADWLYGVSMGSDGVSKVISRRLPPAEVAAQEPIELPAAEAISA
ncbi:MAG TPA: AAA family ATPase [Solirubrobacteraceae bacterium]